jgi:hypothetical protein
VVGKNGGDPMVPRIAMMKAPQRHKPKVTPATRRQRATVYKITELIVMSAVLYGHPSGGPNRMIWRCEKACSLQPVCNGRH